MVAWHLARLPMYTQVAFTEIRTGIFNGPVNSKRGHQVRTTTRAPTDEQAWSLSLSYTFPISLLQLPICLLHLPHLSPGPTCMTSRTCGRPSDQTAAQTVHVLCMLCFAMAQRYRWSCGRGFADLIADPNKNSAVVERIDIAIVCMICKLTSHSVIIMAQWATDIYTSAIIHTWLNEEIRFINVKLTITGLRMSEVQSHSQDIPKDWKFNFSINPLPS